MNLELDGKVIFVAGASRGIGLGIVETLLAEGARVAMGARGAEKLAEAHETLAARFGADRVWSAAGDLTQTADIERIVGACEDGFGPIAGAVANVGLSPSPLGFDIADDVWQAGLDQNLNSGFRFARAVLARMGARKDGALLFISSIAGIDTMGSPLVYGATKAAMNHMAKALSRMAGATGVRVNTIAPGNIIFPGGSWEEASTGPRAEAWARWLKREVPLGRYGAPEEIGAVAAFLLSPRASFVNGATVVVDGGQTR
jgi:3-oxoacyl-[acyl-carrier protein] reductase